MNRSNRSVVLILYYSNSSATETILAIKIMMRIEEIRKLAPRERLKIMEQIWDSLAEEKELPESPAWHEEVIAARKQRLEKGEARLLTLDELKKMKPA